ncbi:peptidoglycan-binding protein [Paraburkholderia sp. BL10I2N1]|uniref:peptidoglycan-binding protein n=1 Tax=Paraburkholderia sp. BL10I2N1 TaxID=1938796 RepID=UPI00105F22FD|nr:peptidoglycan-binding protein [Paraburkholderia sp. BL10I2N1]TDN62165.1 putative peptidoglycan binding protein [Paraburkholderia sp. BL10I2N1]
MSITQLGPHGKKLLQNLRHLFGGNHVHENEILPTNVLTEQYMATAYVVWRFEHDITTSTSKGNASVAGGHFGYRTADYQSHLQRLCQKAVRNRDIRGPFMQRVDAARSGALACPSTAQPVHDFGSYSVFRQCGSCTGSGRISCGGCSGRGKRTCGGCGGVGSHNETVTHTRWNGRHNETYSQTVRRTCPSCGGGGRVVCTSCGGSGKQTCGACSGHGFFTDVSRVKAIARPWWHVPKHTGLAAEALVRALEHRGPTSAQELVPLDLAGTEYNENDNWVVRYTGTAEIVELGIDVVKTNYIVAAAGANVIPIKTPPVFDQLLRYELDHIASLLNGGKRGRSNIRRQAKKLFAVFRSVPVLDEALQNVAKLGKDARENPAPAIVRVAEGFISGDAATSIGTAFLHTLDKVSPANSRAAWAIVAMFPAVASFFSTANRFTEFSPSNPWQAVVPLCFAVVAAALAMLAVSPVGWLLSATISSLLRLKVPAEYRQRGRDWAPLKNACFFTMSASFAGALYGAAGAMHWVPNIRDATTPVVNYAVMHTAQGSEANRFFAGLATPAPVKAPIIAESTVDTRRDVQRFLIAHGYLHGEPDGNLGSRTSAAIARYERHENLNAWTPLPDLLAHMRTVTFPASAASTAFEPPVATIAPNSNQNFVQTGSARRSTIPVSTNGAAPTDKTDSGTVIPCSEDGTYFSRNVCKSAVLSASYEREIQEYEVAQRRIGAADSGVRIEQERWLEMVTRDCADAQCLTSAFEKRTADLNARYRGG